MDIFSRREFLDRAAILAAAAAASTGAAAADDKPASTSRSAGDRLRVAVVGVHGRGMSHVGGFLGKNNCEITTVCDCDEGVIGKAMKSIEGKQGKPPAYVKDIRKVVEDKNIDVVSIATPNHWHALMAVWAMQNGKDVYVEKPATHNVKEGAIMLAAARKYGRICQVGMQSRSNPAMRDAVAAVQSGKIGKVELAIGLCYKRRGSIGKVEGDQLPPKTMDYNLWCGPAPLTPPHRKTGNGTVHYDWHWIWENGNGDLGNQGVHQMDVARWGLKQGMPESVVSFGGRFGYVDDGQTANTQLSLFQFPGAKMLFEVRGLKTDKYKGADVGVIWVGDNGMVVCPNYYSSGIVYDAAGKQIAKFTGGNDQNHFDNFVKAVRSRKHEDLNADISEGHISASLCHLANISYRLGREEPLDQAAGVSDKDMAACAGRLLAHLKENKVDATAVKGRFGPRLAFDSKSHTFTSGGDLAKANALLFREYRKGFELSESV
ncbi:MAG TPA: Gfo/Idh/MocA family oxidoreductase [Urbifossiella sp.]|nr:Gfo/Idh/MocA family oxidoreductase [Urbifossiella sp.]